MSNEELVTLIQSGERDKLAQLWEQVECFVALQARKMASKIQGSQGVTVEDLYQCGYLALVAAVESFSPDAGSSFLNWLTFYLRQEFANWGGWRTKHQKNDPLNHAASLDAPIGDGENDNTTLGDLQPDPDGHRAFEAVEDAEWRLHLRSALDSALDRIPAAQSEAIRRRYFQGKTLKEVGAALGVSKERARQLEEMALISLRTPAVSEPLTVFLEMRTPYFLHVGVQQFHRTQTSAVERIAMFREQLQQRFNTELMKGTSIWIQKHD